MPNLTNFQILALALVVLLGLGSYFWLEWQSSQPIDESQVDSLLDIGQMSIETMQEELEADIASRPKTPVEERLDSALGQALFRKCAEWMDFHENQPSEEARAHRDEACSEYRDYVDNGTPPPSQPNST